MPNVLQLFIDRIDTPIGELLLAADGTGAGLFRLLMRSQIKFREST